MATFKNFIEESRSKNWGLDVDKLTLEQVNLGCSLRMANSLEVIAKDKEDLLKEIKSLKAGYDFVRNNRDELLSENKSLKASKATYKSLYNKFKKECERLQSELSKGNQA